MEDGLARWEISGVAVDDVFLHQDPRECPLPAPSFPPFLAEARRRPGKECLSGISVSGNSRSPGAVAE